MGLLTSNLSQETCPGEDSLSMWTKPLVCTVSLASALFARGLGSLGSPGGSDLCLGTCVLSSVGLSAMPGVEVQPTKQEGWVSRWGWREDGRGRLQSLNHCHSSHTFSAQPLCGQLLSRLSDQNQAPSRCTKTLS